ncbi:hypothetical protein [Candidatus Magnetominusculus dajiuhuensis]|uniref:hypothetical protein n=1 Tax=Candidatus Magnetominusculus dajiuhuensis TaxID=3137712 RepID=UPI003B4356A6
MAGALIQVTIDDGGVQETLNLIAQRVKNLKPVMQLIGERVTASVKENFRAGGRPEMWIPSKRALSKGKTTLINSKRLISPFLLLKITLICAYLTHFMRAIAGM